MPFFLTLLLTCTVCIVLCVYLKENFKLDRILGNSDRSRPDRGDYDTEIFKLRYNTDDSKFQDDDQEERELDSDAQERKKVTDFYIDMMKKEICMNVPDEEALSQRGEDGNYDGFCYPLCEKKFKNGDVMRTISPCGHTFHEKCMRIWLYRGEN